MKMSELVLALGLVRPTESGCRLSDALEQRLAVDNVISALSIDNANAFEKICRIDDITWVALNMDRVNLNNPYVGELGVPFHEYNSELGDVIYIPYNSELHGADLVPMLHHEVIHVIQRRTHCVELDRGDWIFRGERQSSDTPDYLLYHEIEARVVSGEASRRSIQKYENMRHTPNIELTDLFRL